MLFLVNTTARVMGDSQKNLRNYKIKLLEII